MSEAAASAHDSGQPAPSRADGSERLLDFLAVDPVDGTSRPSLPGLSHLLVMIGLHVGCRHMHLALRFEEPVFALSGLIAWGVAIGCLVEQRSGRLVWSPPLLVLTVLLFGYAKLALGNHAAMESLLLLAIAGSVPITHARGTALAGLIRWCCVILFLNSGLQKVIYGAYWNGSFLARRVASDRFGWVLELALPKDEFLRLLEANRAGVMVFESVQGLLLSNAVYLSEIGCAVLLLIPRTRALGFWVAILTVIGIEVVAREVGFGLMFILMLLLFRPAVLERRAILLLPIGAHLGLAAVEMMMPGVLLW